MDIRQLGYFISVAENLNFTKAAKQHFIAQTSISQQIMALEQHVGAKLFHRNNRLVQLTAAGKVFYNEAKIIVARSEEAINKTLQAVSGFEGTLKIGFLGPNEKWFLPELIRYFRRTYPTIDLTLTQNNMEKLREALEQGLMDVAFNFTLGIDTTSGITWKTIYKDPICILIYRDHPLANEPRIRLSDLSNESFIAIDRREAPFAFDAMIQECVNSGFSPNIVVQSRSFETILFMVEAEMGIALVPRCFEMYTNKNLRFIELEGEQEYVELVVAWMKNNLNPAIPLFIKALEDRTNHYIYT